MLHDNFQDTRYYVKRYTNFPHRDEADVLMDEFDNIADAQDRSLDLNARESGYRYYIQEDPHEWIELTKSQREFIKKNYPQSL